MDFQAAAIVLRRIAGDCAAANLPQQGRDLLSIADLLESEAEPCAEHPEIDGKIEPDL